MNIYEHVMQDYVKELRNDTLFMSSFKSERRKIVTQRYADLSERDIDYVLKVV
jgi:hypothetical protein